MQKQKANSLFAGCHGQKYTPLSLSLSLSVSHSVYFAVDPRTADLQLDVDFKSFKRRLCFHQWWTQFPPHLEACNIPFDCFTRGRCGEATRFQNPGAQARVQTPARGRENTTGWKNSFFGGEGQLRWNVLRSVEIVRVRHLRWGVVAHKNNVLFVRISSIFHVATAQMGAAAELVAGGPNNLQTEDGIRRN